jgi:mercuric ion transport protein
MERNGAPLMTSTDLGQSRTTKPLPAPSTGLLAGTGAVVGISALVASSCCVLPIALAGLGVTGAVFSGLAFLADIRPFLIAGAAAMLALGWAFFFWRRRGASCDGDTCARPERSGRMIALLGFGSLVVGLALVWGPYVEPALLRLAR